MNAELQNQLVQAQLADASARAEEAAKRLAAAQKLESDLLEARKALVLLAQTDQEAAAEMQTLKRQALEARLELEQQELLHAALEEERLQAQQAAEALKIRESAQALAAQLDAQLALAADIDATFAAFLAKMRDFETMGRTLAQTMRLEFPGGHATPHASNERLFASLERTANALKNGQQASFTAATEQAMLNSRIVKDHRDFPKDI